MFLPPPPGGDCLLYSIAVSPHSQLLLAAGTVGGLVLLGVGLLLGNPYGLPADQTGVEPTLVRVTVVDVDIAPDVGEATAEQP